MVENTAESPKPQVERGPGGKLLPGSVLNPDGESGKDDVWQPYGTRSRYWLKKLTRGEIKKLAMNEEKLDELSSYDAIIITHLAASMAGKNMSRERAQLLSYVEGMPVQTIQTREITKPTQKEVDDTTDQEALEEYDRLTKE